MDTLTTILLWLLGVAFLVGGAMKAFSPASSFEGNERMAWVEREGLTKTRIAGFSEVAAAVVFILTALGIIEGTLLAGLAALGIVVIMGLAAFTVHAPHDEPIVPNLVLGALAAVLAVLAFLG